MKYRAMSKSLLNPRRCLFVGQHMCMEPPDRNDPGNVVNDISFAFVHHYQPTYKPSYDGGGLVDKGFHYDKVTARLFAPVLARVRRVKELMPK